MISYPIAAEALDLEIYQLACIFAGSQELLSKSKAYYSLKALVDVFELSEASRKIISIAVALRSSLDSNPRELSKEITGTLIKNIKEPISEALDFREACNKIIHAVDIEFFNDNDPDQSLNWSLKLFGSYNKKDWEATLSVLQFIEIAHKLT